MDNGIGSTLEAALKYNALGMSVIPLRPHDKLPLVEWRKYQHERASEATIRSWWNEWPSANVGVVTGAISGLVVLDQDSAESDTFAANLPPTPVVKTAKGRHFYFAHPGGEIRNWTKKIPGFDLRGDGGYVVVPPSMHPDGTQYTWDVDLDRCARAPLPQNIAFPSQRPQSASGSFALDTAPALTSHPYVEAVWRGELATLARAKPGERNDALNRAAFALGHWVPGGYIERAVAEDTLEAVACTLGLDDDPSCGLSGIRATITSGLNAGIKEPGTIPPLDGAGTPQAPASHGDRRLLWQRWVDALLTERATLIWTEASDAYIQLVDGQLLAVESDDAALWFQARTQRDAAYGSDSWRKAAGALRSWAKEHGQPAQVYQRAHTDFERGVAYIGITGDRKLYRITPAAIEIQANGVDGVLVIGGSAPLIPVPQLAGELARWLIRETWADGVSTLTLAIVAVMLAMGTAQTYHARPIVIATGGKGSGKTTTLNLLSKAIVGASRVTAQKVKNNDTNDARLVNEHVAIFDNVDQPLRGIDFEDFLATASTSDTLSLRKLYSNADLIRKPFTAFVAITSFTMPRVIKRSDVQDRSLILRFVKAGRTKDDDQRVLDTALLWNDLLILAQRVLARWPLTPIDSELRTVGFMRIAYALVGVEAAALEQELLRRQAETVAHDDVIALALQESFPEQPLTAANLLCRWSRYWEDEPEAPKTPKGLGKMLKERAGTFGDWVITGEPDRTRTTVWTFTRSTPHAGFDHARAQHILHVLAHPSHLCRVWGLDCSLNLGNDRQEEAPPPHGEQEGEREATFADDFSLQTLQSASQSPEPCRVYQEAITLNPAGAGKRVTRKRGSLSALIWDEVREAMHEFLADGNLHDAQRLIAELDLKPRQRQALLALYSEHIGARPPLGAQEELDAQEALATRPEAGTNQERPLA